MLDQILRFLYIIPKYYLNMLLLVRAGNQDKNSKWCLICKNYGLKKPQMKCSLTSAYAKH